MKIVFMGTPEFACKPMKALCESRHELLAVVTGVDKPRGRGKKTVPTPVCEEAVCANIPIIKVDSLKDENLYHQLLELKPDLIIVIAFRILPQRIIDIPRLGAINIHASLLPKYRGAAPINWALINGEKETGLTGFFLKRKVDTGDMILQEKISINEEENFDSLYERLSDMSGDFLLKLLDLIESGQAKPIAQNDQLASPAPKIQPFDAMIDFGFPAVNVVNFIRGMSTKPGAYTFLRGDKLKILSARIADLHSSDEKVRPGTIVKTKKELLVQCADQPIALTLVVPEGKKPMDGLSFVNGFRIETGEIMGESPTKVNG